MDIDQIWQYAPKAIVTLVGLGLLYELRKYKRKNDVAAWLREMYARTAKAAKDENYRQSEIADADAEIAKYPVPDPIVPITNKQQIRIAAFPKMLFMSGLTGMVFLYFGLFETMPEGVKWPVYAGWGFLAVTFVLYWMAEKTRPYYRRVQQLNRKYLLQKAGGDADRFDTLKEVLQYYPNVSELWLELGDQYAVDKRYDDAVAAMQSARAIAPEKIDLAIIEASFHLRRHDAEAVTRVLNEAEQLKKADTDPRIAIYRGALALQKNEKKTALRYGKEALELDPDFTERLVKNDKGLTELSEFWAQLFEERESELLNAVAARQEARETASEDGEAEETEEKEAAATETDVEKALEEGEAKG